MKLLYIDTATFDGQLGKYIKHKPHLSEVYCSELYCVSVCCCRCTRSASGELLTVKSQFNFKTHNISEENIARQKIGNSFNRTRIKTWYKKNKKKGHY